MSTSTVTPGDAVPAVAPSPPAAVPPEVDAPPEKGTRQGRRGVPWFGTARSARTRILAAYVVLLAVSAVLAVFAIREVLLIRVDDQVADALEQEMRELDRLLADGRDPTTGQPFTSLQALFDVYLARNVPSVDEAMLTFVDGEFYRSAAARFPLDRLPAESVSEWEDLSGSSPAEGESAVGSFETDLGKGQFRVARVRLGDDSGAFVVTIVPAEELGEIEELQKYGVAGALGVLLLASLIAWFITGRVLSPVKQLTETAGLISQSDLTSRITVRGTGEAADMARTFNAMLDRLETVFRHEREFVQDASHELRDPLTICRGHLELLSDDPVEHRETIELVMDELDRMGRIVDDLSLLAEVEQPDFIQPEDIDMAVFTHELAAKAGALAPRDWRLDEVADRTLFADRHRLTEAAMNLAHNAVQHTVAGQTVAIGTAARGDEVHLWVRDSGMGISTSDQERIFDRFKRGAGAHRRYRGGGLGLAIVKAIAEAHRGHVELESRVGEGSKFTIVVPLTADEGRAGGQDPDR